MRRLLHLVGRAWSFVTANLQEDTFVINHGGNVPNFIKGATDHLQSIGRIKTKVWDMEGCYTNMPREPIRYALRDIACYLRKTHGRAGVVIPRFSDTKPCTWMPVPPQRETRRGVHKAENIYWGNDEVAIDFDTLLDIMEFALDHSVIKMPNGELWRQDQGIPMGDAISPGMTIGACAWMEKEWMQSIDKKDLNHFRAARYMDDVFMIYAEHEGWDSNAFIKDFERSECYFPPLNLEEGEQDTFLETRFRVEDDNNITYWLKNANEDGRCNVWRYQHFHSYSPFLQKRALVTACLKKVHNMASTPSVLEKSAHDKLAEFRRLQYPRGLLKKATAYMAASTGQRMWLNVRDAI